MCQTETEVSRYLGFQHQSPKQWGNDAPSAFSLKASHSAENTRSSD